MGLLLISQLVLGPLFCRRQAQLWTGPPCWSPMGEERDLFSRLYTYEEVQARQRKEKEKPNEKPAHWPDDTVPDPAKWSFWLPDGWGQGLKTTISGKTLRCYIGPPPVGKRFFHKPDIEKYIGYALEKKELPKEDEQGKKVVGSVHDSVPPWPKESDWLPKDWKIGWRHLPTKLHRIYVPPGHDEGFLWHRSEVDEYLAGTRTTLTPIKSSKKMVEISAKAAAAGTQKKRKIVTDDYEECAALHVLCLPVESDESASKFKAAGVLDAQALCREGAEIRELLVSRKFPRETELLVVTAQEQKTPSDAQLAFKRLQGWYHAMEISLGGRPVYQKVMQVPVCGCGVACGGEYIFWSEGQKCWRIGDVDEATSCLAFCKDSQPRVTEVRDPWRLLPDCFLKPRE
mmetsp:Transcript_73160/g.164356  ORF Transcript_73160/g.164356 Transcript_73160/m.164356 type:complete len:400 (-) Transcript_73160:181-1380(-)